MGDRSLGDVVGGGLFWTGVIMIVPRVFHFIFSNFLAGLGVFFALVFAGYFLQLFSGDFNAVNGPVAMEQVHMSGYGTLDRLNIYAENTTGHEIKWLDATCNGEDVYFTNIPAYGTGNYNRFVAGAVTGGVICEINEIKSK